MSLLQTILQTSQNNGFSASPLSCDWTVQETVWLGNWLTPSDKNLMSLLVTLRQVPYQNTFMHISFYDTVIADPVCACHGQETRCHPQWGRRVPLLPTMETLPPTVTLSTITIHRLMVSRRPSLANNTITEIFKYVL